LIIELQWTKISKLILSNVEKILIFTLNSKTLHMKWRSKFYNCIH